MNLIIIKMKNKTYDFRKSHSVDDNYVEFYTRNKKETWIFRKLVVCSYVSCLNKSSSYMLDVTSSVNPTWLTMTYTCTIVHTLVINIYIFVIIVSIVKFAQKLNNTYYEIFAISDSICMNIIYVLII